MNTLSSSLTCFVLICFALPAATFAQLDLRTVVLSGDPISFSGSDTKFSQFGDLVFNNLGHTAFSAELTGSEVDATNDLGIFGLDTMGELTVEVRSGFGVPGADPGVNFRSFDSLVLNANNQVAFQAALIGTGVDSSNDQAILMTSVDSNLEAVARSGDVAAVAGTGFNFGELGRPALSDSGKIAFKTQFVATGSGGDNSSGILKTQSAGGLGIVARQGDTAPLFGLDPETPVPFSAFSDPVLNSSGDVGFRSIRDPSPFVPSADGIYAQWNGVLQSVAVAGPRHTTILPDTSLVALGEPKIDSAGRVYFGSELFGKGQSDSGIFNRLNEDIVELLVEDGINPYPSPYSLGLGTELYFESFGSSDSGLIPNDREQFAFTASLAGNNVSSANDAGIFNAGPDDGLQMVALKGDMAPGVESDLRFGGFGGLAFNESGQSAFVASLVDTSGTNSGSPDFGIFAENAAGILNLIAKVGDQINVSYESGVDDFRTISGFSLADGVGLDDGVSVGFNDLGQVAFTAEFMDGSSGIFVSDGVSIFAGDFNNDGMVNTDDIDAYIGQIGLATTAAGAVAALDLDGDGLITLEDHDLLIEKMMQRVDGGIGTFIGDLNRDGDVDIISYCPPGAQCTQTGDAYVMLSNLGINSGQNYADGDLNADGDVDISELVLIDGQFINVGDVSRLLTNLGAGHTGAATPSAAAVPEPGSLLLLVLAGLSCGILRR